MVNKGRWGNTLLFIIYSIGMKLLRYYVECYFQLRRCAVVFLIVLIGGKYEI